MTRCYVWERLASGLESFGNLSADLGQELFSSLLMLGISMEIHRHHWFPTQACMELWKAQIVVCQIICIFKVMNQIHLFGHEVCRMASPMLYLLLSMAFILVDEGMAIYSVFQANRLSPLWGGHSLIDDLGTEFFPSIWLTFLHGKIA